MCYDVNLFALVSFAALCYAVYWYVMLCYVMLDYRMLCSGSNMVAFCCVVRCVMLCGDK